MRYFNHGQITQGLRCSQRAKNELKTHVLRNGKWLAFEIFSLISVVLFLFSSRYYTPFCVRGEKAVKIIHPFRTDRGTHHHLNSFQFRHATMHFVSTPPKEMFHSDTYLLAHRHFFASRASGTFCNPGQSEENMGNMWIPKNRNAEKLWIGISHLNRM